VSSLEQLIAQREELERKIREAQSAEREAGIAEIKAIMTRLGLSARDLGAMGVSTGPAAPKSPKTSKVAPKYRDPTPGSTQTWSGRGLQPNWVKKAIESGKSLDDLRI
jgi:DNA-binding protein H-NS